MNQTRTAPSRDVCEAKAVVSFNQKIIITFVKNERKKRARVNHQFKTKKLKLRFQLAYSVSQKDESTLMNLSVLP